MKNNPDVKDSRNVNPDGVDIPELDTQTASELLSNVFDACDMQPNSIPIDVLEKWGNYKKPPFEKLKKLAVLIILLLILMPFMFFKPSIIAERTNVDDTASAVYSINVKSLLPLSSVSASIDGAPVPLKAEDSKNYTAKIETNGKLEIVAVSFNGQTAKRTYEVNHIDNEKPKFIDSYAKDGYVYLLVRDTYSGIDYDNITGIEPESYDEQTGLIKFKIPDKPTAVGIPDKAGNVSSLLLSPVE